MAAVKPKQIKILIEQIRSLEESIRTAGDVGRAKLQAIKVTEILQQAPTIDDKFDEKWNDLAEEKQNELLQCLMETCDSLRRAAALDGPSDPKHIMHPTYASTYAIIFWAFGGFSLTIALLYVIHNQWSLATATEFAVAMQDAATQIDELEKAKAAAATAGEEEANAQQEVDSASDGGAKQEAGNVLETKKQLVETRKAAVEAAQDDASAAAIAAIQEMRRGGATERTVFAMVILLGALGGSLHMLGSMMKYIGNRQFMRSWLPHYVAMPILGAGIAPIVYMLLRVGILTPSSTMNGGGTSNLNLVGIYAFAALSGLFAGTATDKLGEVFRTLFRTGEASSKDQLGAETPPGSPSV